MLVIPPDILMFCPSVRRIGQALGWNVRK